LAVAKLAVGKEQSGSFFNLFLDEPGAPRRFIAEVTISSWLRRVDHLGICRAWMRSDGKYL